MKNVIQITDKILGVIVPERANIFKISGIGYLCYKNTKYDSQYQLIEDLIFSNHKIHGTCTLPAFDFDFEVTDKMASCSSSCSQSDYHKGGKCDRNGCYGKGKKGMFANKIQKAIQDEGMFVVNPYENPMQNSDNGFYGFNTRTGDKIMKWQSAESKTVKKLLLIEKI